MIWYKSSIQERSSPLGAKMGRGSPVCQQIREKIIEMFKNNVPQRKIGRDLDISPSTVHNIIKRFKESGGISVRKGQGRKPKLNNRDLRSLRRHCIKNRHSSISDITSQSKFRNHYFLFLFAFSILSQLFLIWGCTSIPITLANVQ